MPYLAHKIDLFNSNNTEASEEDAIRNSNNERVKINLKGIMIGNGVTNWTYDADPAFVKMGYQFNLYSPNLRKQMDDNNCTYSGEDN